MPCGTAEAGIFNFAAVAQLACHYGPGLKLACLVEPDHGTNILACDLDYLIARIHAGIDRGRLALAGRDFSTLRSIGRHREIEPEATGARRA